MWLTTKELAKRLKRNPSTFYRWRKKNKWKEGVHYRFTTGGWPEYNIEAIEEYLNTPIAKRKP